MITDRTYFNKTWLEESPQKASFADYYQNLVKDINTLIKRGKEPKDIGNNFKKISMETVAYYWYEQDGEIQLVAELSKKPQALQMRLLGKKFDLKGKPFASDLYTAILNDATKPIRVESDFLLTDEGFKIWQQLYKDGNTISVYNSDKPGESFHTLDSLDDFNNYFGDKDFKKYIFVLNESTFLAETITFFNTRRIRELSSIDLED